MFRIIPEGLGYKEHVLLKNGQGLLFKPATEKEIPLVESFMKRVSRESLRMRFMAAMSEVPKNIVVDLCKGDFKESGCILAIVGEKKNEKVVGLGNYIGMGNGRTAEVAFLIEDVYQGKGISTLLLERLAGLAAANGYVELEAEVLPDNQPMINVFNSSGFEKHKVWDSDTVHFEIPVNGAAALWEQADLRERIAVANSLVPLLRPESIAVIGASRNPSSIGNIILKNIISGGFKGKIFPVNPNAEKVNDIKSYPSVNSIKNKIDLAVIALPAESVQIAAEEIIKAGAKGIVIVSAGFAEAGPEGIKRQKELVSLVRANGVRLLGPSCLGLMNTDPSVSMNASLAPKIMIEGNAGFFSHSAALGLVILEYAKEKGVGFTTFVSAGNRADISGNDLLHYWAEDPATRMAILYLETFGNPRRFVRIARRMSFKKPILCVKSAKSVAGKKAAEAKSGLIAGGGREIDALFQQTGIILAPSLESLFDVAVVIAHQPLPKGNRVSVIANSSGMATLFADACEHNDLVLEGPGVVDLGAFTSPENYESVVKEALINENVDSLLIGFACVGDCSTEPVAEAIRKGVSEAEKSTGIKKPVLLCLMGAVGTVSLINESDSENENDKRNFPAFRFPESAVSALGRVVRYAEFRKQNIGKLVWYQDVKSDESRKFIQSFLSGSDVFEPDISSSKKILSHFGFEFLESIPENAKSYKIHVKPDPLFGPIIILRFGDLKSIFRITPLTEHDIDEIMEEMNLDRDSRILNILGRISQMIEEIPWLWELEVSTIDGTKPIISNNILMRLKPGGAGRPSY
ncbi:MAG TPA: GNAT family N-acetyltransferase [Ignavibacteriaceae bacterium]|nr:GNAT family N-acetyltransferase [Ignavibacteriaceae bacterium]